MQHYSEPTSRLSARSNAERWLTRFAPLLETPLDSSSETLRQLKELRKEGEKCIPELSAWATEDDQILLTTLRDALEHLKAKEASLRPQLSESGGALNLTELRAKLAEASARQELGETPLVPQELELLLTGGNLAAAAGTGFFALFWNGFTLVHATFMIGGMWKAFGPVALFLLAFYALFFGVGFTMVKAALDAASKEELLLRGTTLTIRKTLGLWVREKVLELGPQSRAGLDLPLMRAKGSRTMAITINDAQGRTHQCGAVAPEHLKSDYVRQLNAYLVAQRGA
ncbi:hypothetical protein [Armatimonas sp.]|uniref:hypothetical protein n=1 Tax=Armatimonas sp. TaxID=1872638 RepID=UPI00286CD85D|nr:hypothetical protein [Armatimonas sp.]